VEANVTNLSFANTNIKHARVDTPASKSGRTCSQLCLLDGGSLATSDEAGSARSNETDLLAVWGGSGHSARVTDVLVVTTTMRVIDGVHRNTSHSGPLLLLCAVLEVRVVGLQDGLVGSLAASDDADHASAGALNGSSHTRWQPDASLLSVFGVTNDDGRAARCASEGSAVALLALKV